MADNSGDSDTKRVRRLVLEMCAGALSEEGVGELSELLASSEEARSLYWRIITVHSQLESDLGNRMARDYVLAQQILSIAGSAANGSIVTKGRHSKTWWLTIAACLLIVMSSGIWIFRSFENQRLGETVAERPNEHLEAAPIIGQLSPLAPRSSWSFGRRNGRNPPDVCLGDTISIDVGTVELALRNNVVAQMKAPLVLHLVSSERVRLLHGRIQVDVPEGAEGFSVETASAEIVDLGTSFSVEVADGGTDLIVREGEVDLKVIGASENEQQPDTAARRFRGGEAVRVHLDGTLSRIVNVHSTDMLISESESIQSHKPLIASVRDNLIRDDMWSFYEIVPGGLDEDAKAFVDRPHEWNGATANGLPDYLVGADYVKTFNDDKITPDLVIELELAGPAEVYVFMDRRLTPPSWLTDQFSETRDIIGIDEDHYVQSVTTGVGPGASIDQTFSVWKLVAEHGGAIKLGPNGDPGPHDPDKVIFVPSNMYGVAVVRIPGGDQ